MRGDDLLKAFKENAEFLCQEIKSIAGVTIDPTGKDAIQNIYEEFTML